MRGLRARTGTALAAALAVATTAVAAGLVAPRHAGAATLSPANGQGSSYAGLAFQQWVTDGQTLGLPVNYTPNSSPQGLEAFNTGTIQYAGTEAEFASLLGPGVKVNGGFEYTPDVAGAVAVMYNAQDQAGRPVTYLHLSQRTVARIFMGYITNWDSPEISADNLGLVLPSHPITIIYRAGQSGTTALFYDFVAHADPADFTPWATAHNLPTTTRIIQLDNGSNFAPLTEAVSGSDQQATDVRNQPWSISYDEFAYPKTYGAQVAWVRNGAGRYTQPYALNITAALASATLNPDLSQNLSGVYASTNPLTYPISAYSYIVTKCAINPQFPTCQGSYSDPGVSNTLGTWMRYIACDGQVHTAAIGYAPLPPNLSQDMANSVARITGQPAVTLSASNCANPRFNGLLGVGAAGPPDPYLTLTRPSGSQTGTPTSGSPGSGGSSGGTSGGGGAGGAAGSGAPGGGATSGGGSSTAVGATPGQAGTRAGAAAGGSRTSGAVASGAKSAVALGALAASPQAGKVGGAVVAVGGGSGDVRQPAPIAYTHPLPGGPASLPLLAFLAILVVPLFRIRRIRSRLRR